METDLALESKKNTLRNLGFIEATSLLLLMGVAMPLKHIWGYPAGVRIVGTVHGVLFMVYAAAALVVGRELGWSWLKVVGAWIVSSIPFGPFVLDRYFFGGKSNA